MSPSRDPSDDSERDALADLHREASKAVDERPDPRVRDRVLAAAREAEAFTRARDAREKARRKRDVPAEWPRSVAAVLAVAVVTAFLAGRFWPDGNDLGDSQRPAANDTIARVDAPLVASTESTMKAVPAPAAAAIDGAAIARERRPDRRSFSRDRDDPVVVAKKADSETSATESAAAPEQVARADVAPADAVSANDTHVAAAPFPQAPTAAPIAVAPAPPLSEQAARVARRASAGANAEGTLGLSAALTLAAPSPSPQAWVQSILQLRHAGRDAEADAEVRRLRQRYPEFVIPPEALAPAAKP